MASRARLAYASCLGPLETHLQRPAVSAVGSVRCKNALAAVVNLLQAFGQFAIAGRFDHQGAMVKYEQPLAESIGPRCCGRLATAALAAS